MRSLLVLPLVLAAACAASPSQRVARPAGDNVVIPPPPPGSLVTHRWEYFCINSPTDRQLNAAGAHGWELVSAVAEVAGVSGNVGTGSYTFCFKRPLPLEPTTTPAAADGPPGAAAPLEVGRAELVGALAEAKAVAAYEGRDLVGVRLHGVADGSTLARAGLAERDVITRVAGEPVRSVEDVVARLEASDAPVVRVVVRRGQLEQILELRLR